MKRFEKITTRLKIAKNKISNKNYQNDRSNVASLGSALKISTELVAAVVVSSTFGFILDNWFGTKPWLIITFFFIGVVTGILNVIRSAKSMNRKGYIIKK
tara:strand:+ start:105 stop:404 length:300 start_codon:yes stop_codon:yes gene_type:complete